MKRPARQARDQRRATRLLLLLVVLGGLGLLLSAQGHPTEPTRRFDPVGHVELRVDAPNPNGGQAADASYTPVIFGSAARPGLCAQVLPTEDTSHWQLHLKSGGQRFGPLQPSVRTPERTCFELPADLRWRNVRATLSSPREPNLTEVCGQLETPEGTESVPCWRLEFREFDEPLQRFETKIAQLDREAQASLSDDDSLTAFLSRADTASAAARRAGYPLTSARFDLLAAHHARLSLSSTGLLTARERLSQLPAIAKHPLARDLLADWLFAQGQVALDLGDAPSAWRDYAASERLSRDLAETEDARSAVLGQVSVLEAQGDVRAGAIRLREELARPTTGGHQLPGSQGGDPWAIAYQAWLTVLDRNSRAQERQRSALAVRHILRTAPYENPLEQANQWITVALLELQNQVPSQPPNRAPEMAARLLQDAPASVWRDTLEAWLALAKGLEALTHGDAETARERCVSAYARGQNAETQDALLTAWALECQARAFVHSGELEAASYVFEELLLRHATQRLEETAGQENPSPSGPSARALLANHHLQAARLDLDRNDPHSALTKLRRLDQLLGELPPAHSEEQGASCTKSDAHRQDEIEHLLADLRSVTLQGPVAWQRDALQIRADLKSRIDGLWRERPLCAPDGEPASVPTGEDFRAFALQGEVFLLDSQPPALVKRTQLDLELVLADLAGNEAQAQQRALKELSDALIPQLSYPLSSETRFALHGSLQSIPLAALRNPDGSHLLTRTTPIKRPAAAQRDGKQTATLPVHALFVVDPKRNLGASKRSLELYSQLFEDSAMLYGADASRAAFRAQLAELGHPREPARRILHVDAHAVFDQIFPVLSHVELSDANLHFFELELLELELELTNLAACSSSSWPTTQDSGRYGLSGLMVKRGSRFAIGSHGPLDNRLALAFNQAFYREFAAGLSVPAAFQQALLTLRKDYHEPEWSMIELFGI